MKKVYLLTLISISVFTITNAQLIVGRLRADNSISAKTYKNSQDKLAKANADFVQNNTDDNKKKLEQAKTDFKVIPKPAKFTAVAGAFSFPFKLRPQSGVLEPSLSLSGVGGVDITSNRLNDSTNSNFGFYLGVGPSSITLNSSNSTVSSTTTRSAITFSFTFLYEVEGLQLALSTGVDNNLDNSTDKWHYQSKPWFSAGIGFAIFTKSKK